MVARRTRLSRPSRLARVLDELEAHYGELPAAPASDPYEMLVLLTCGYPASEIACAKGFAALRECVGIAPKDILRATDKKLALAMRAGGIVPELRAARLREIANRVAHEYGGDLRSALGRSVPAAKRILKSFPAVADAGAEKVLLFSRLAPVMAVPSNATHVPLRLGFGREGKNWAAGYKSAQEALSDELPVAFEPRIRAHLLFKHHAQILCKRSRPACDRCPVAPDCGYAQTDHTTGRTTPS
jgi:endonuclease III